MLDLTSSIAGGFCTGLLARMGADVARAEDPDRRGATRVVHAYIHAGKRSTVQVVGASLDCALLDLSERADVIVTDDASCFDLPDPLRGSPRVVVTLNGFSELPARESARHTELALWAESGLLDLARGTSGEPVPPPGFQASYYVGAHAAVAVVAAVMHARATGESPTIEVNASDVLSSLLLATGELDRDDYLDDGGSQDGRRSCLIEAADGDVLLNLSSVYVQDFIAFARGWGLIGDAPHQSEAELCKSAARAMRQWSRTEIVERAQEWRLPAGAVLSLEELESDEQIRHRGTLRNVDDPALGTVTMPWLPWVETARSA